MAEKKAGRPKSGYQTRDAEISFSTTAEDAAWFDEVADKLGFRSRSEFFSSIAERLRLGGLAPVIWLRIGYQIAKRAHEVGAAKGAGFVNPFLTLPPLDVEDKLPRPPMVLPVEELAPAEAKRLLSEVRKQLT